MKKPWIDLKEKQPANEEKHYFVFVGEFTPYPTIDLWVPGEGFHMHDDVRFWMPIPIPQDDQGNPLFEIYHDGELTLWRETDVIPQVNKQQLSFFEENNEL